MKISSYKELIVWQKSTELVDIIYSLTKLLSKEEIFGLTSQMRRAAISIPSNIAEGYKRNHKAEFVQFLGIANASAAELETQLIISQNQYPSIEWKKAMDLLIEIQKMLHVMISKLKN